MSIASAPNTANLPESSSSVPRKTWLATLKTLCWKLLTLPPIGIVYIALISEGMRQLLPTLGQRLSRQPGLSFLRRYEGWHRLDLAHIMAGILLITVFYSWCINLRLLFAPHEFEARTGWRLDAYRTVAMILATTVLICDGTLFYHAMSHGESIWEQANTISYAAVLTTIAYTAIIVFVSFIAVTLEKE